MPKLLEERHSDCNEDCNVSFKEVYNAMAKKEFKALLESVILSDSEIELQCSYKSLLFGVASCLERLRPYKEDVQTDFINDLWISKLICVHPPNNKISLNISIDENFLKIDIIDVLNRHTQINRKKYYLVDKIIQVLENERMQEETCDEYIRTLTTKYISLANVINETKKIGNNNSNISSKSVQSRSVVIKDLLLSSNLPLTELDIIDRWSKMLFES